MIKQLRLTVLSENTAGARGLLAEHGLAFWIEADGHNILFDTGQGMVLAHNAKALGIDLADTHDLVLSHGHFDHTGGLLDALQSFRHARAYLHPSALESKFSKGADGVAQFIGSPVPRIDHISSHVEEIVLTTKPTELVDGVCVTGEIPRKTEYEDAGGAFYTDEACTTPDPLIDDQALYIRTPKGIVVFLGCAHSGLVNTIEYIVELTGQEQIHAVLGGMHLIRASDERIERTVEALERRDVQILGPAHCTGRKATIRLWQRFPDRCVECVTGAQIILA
jgi:7,8-dihydropterin-6-yl-methyl-4-(beta-D-ribofuranosyl)aminobenzene 5'-phosphate synthase